jgi:Cation efflux family
VWPLWWWWCWWWCRAVVAGLPSSSPVPVPSPGCKPSRRTFFRHWATTLGPWHHSEFDCSSNCPSINARGSLDTRLLGRRIDRAEVSGARGRPDHPSFMPLCCISNGARSLKPVTVSLRLRTLRTRSHQLQQSRVLQTATPNTATPRSLSNGCLPFHSFPKLQSLTNNLNPRHRPMAALSQTQTRSHGGHSHHHHDNTYLTSTNKNDAGVRITRIGLYSNLGMAVAKGVGGYVFNSQSMIADAWHSLTGLASDILTLATVSWSLKPPTAKFPTGFGKVESLGSLGVSGMLLFGGCFMCLNSCEILYAHFFLDAHAAAEVAMHSHGHSHSHAAVGPSLHAAWLAAGTVILKEWLYQASKCDHSHST